MGEIASHPSFEISAPEKLSPAHKLTEFDCGEPVLNDWLKKRALANNNRTSQTFVIQIKNIAIGYYSLAAGAIELRSAPPKLKRNSVDPIPVIILGRLAIDEKYQGKGLGPDLLRDAIIRAIRISEDVGVRALLVHALNDDAVRFYRHFEFLESPIHARTLMLPLDAASKLL